MIVAALLTLGQTDAANWCTDRLPADPGPRRPQLLLQKIQLLQTDARKVEARQMRGAALAEYRPVRSTTDAVLACIWPEPDGRFLRRRGGVDN